MIDLGKTGIRMSRLGQGTGVHGGELELAVRRKNAHAERDEQAVHEAAEDRRRKLLREVVTPDLLPQLILLLTEQRRECTITLREHT